MSIKGKGAKGKHASHAAQKPSKGTFGKKGSPFNVGKGDAGSSASKTSAWSEKSWEGNGSAVKPADPVAAYKSSSENYKSKRKGRNGKKIAAIAVGIVAAVLLAVYVAGGLFFSSHYYPNSKVGDNDISLMSMQDASDDLDAMMKAYTVHVKGQGLDFTVDATGGGAGIDTAEVAKSAMEAESGWNWPVELFKQHDFTHLLEYAYNGTELGKKVKSQVKAVNKTATPPTDATIGYDSAKKKFVVKEEKVGTQLNYDKVMEQISQGIISLRETVTIGQTELEQPKVTSDDKRLAKAAKKANKFLKANAKLTLAGKKVATVDADTIYQWVKLDKDLNSSLDTDKVKQWVSKLAAKVDTVGSKRTLKTGNGGTYTVEGGDYGWSIDQDALYDLIVQAVEKGSTESIAIPCTSEAKVYNPKGSDIGTRYVDVNLRTQHAVFYVNGKKVWAADIITGKPDGEHDTPEGTWYITNKESPSKLVGQMTSNNKPEYETEVSYWMPFVGNSIGLHDATWQPDFGGTMYKEGYGSHGCVNLSLTKAGALYDLIEVGDVVITHR